MKDSLSNSESDNPTELEDSAVLPESQLTSSAPIGPSPGSTSATELTTEELKR
jgi:hypothetical protein